MITNLLKTLLICTFSFNLIACVGDNIADEMQNSTAQLNELKLQIIVLNNKLANLQNLDTDMSNLNLILVQILDILKKLPLFEQQKFLNTLDPKLKTLIVKNMEI